MRPDMHKVLVEKPRRGQGYDRAGVRRKPKRIDEDGECYLKQEGMKRPWNGFGNEGKDLSDLLGPLYGYFEKQVGRPWDKVYSEMSKVLDFRSVHGFHVLSHVRDKVKRHCRVVDGRVYYPGSGWLERRWPELDKGDLYVHPTDGLLKRYNREPVPMFPKKPKKPVTEVKLTDRTRYQQINGLWYYVEYRVAEREVVKERPWGKFTYTEPYDIIEFKRQLSKRELRDLKLSNIVSA